MNKKQNATRYYCHNTRYVLTYLCCVDYSQRKFTLLHAPYYEAAPVLCVDCVSELSDVCGSQTIDVSNLWYAAQNRAAWSACGPRLSPVLKLACFQ